METVKEIENYSNYTVNEFGNVYSSSKGGFLTPDKNQFGYVRYHLYGIKRRSFVIHLLVAEAFCVKPKTNEKLFVHHIDCDRSNNKASNLLWVTKKQHLEIHKKIKSNKVISILTT